MNYLFSPVKQGKPPSLASLLVCGLDLSWAALQVPWPNGATGFALWTLSSAYYTLGASIAGLCSFQVFLIRPFCLGGSLEATLSREPRHDSATLPDDPDQAHLHPAAFPRQKAPILALRRSKVAGRDYDLGAAGRSSRLPRFSCWLLRTPSPLSVTDSQRSGPTDSPRGKTRMGTPKKWP